jgi:hypothetical protein
VAELIEEEFGRLAANNITLSELCASVRSEKKEKKKKKTRAPRYYVPKEEEGVPVINAWEFEDCQVVEGGRGFGGVVCVYVCVCVCVCARARRIWNTNTERSLPRPLLTASYTSSLRPHTLVA